MKNLSVFSILLLVLFIAAGSEVMMGEACEEQFSFGAEFCDAKTCENMCIKKRGRNAKGRCKLIDTCFCQYPC
ncbi:hypothetical protein F0562_005819 [Nyssa sinensis]|uniref:Knottin scorpion toxin-like domain-containing protein n=1 Tax=Nyssa sinensis TaxID=561372 RepID=A0A5J5AKE0_9ASTE|nr:hypothetical protein F0562_005819 [Nyssa sinensis]